jgi:Asp-tRNA(Asn)/Glu-tRNA(Gln) amidotransferase B subunit
MEVHAQITTQFQTVFSGAHPLHSAANPIIPMCHLWMPPCRACCPVLNKTMCRTSGQNGPGAERRASTKRSVFERKNYFLSRFTAGVSNFANGPPNCRQGCYWILIWKTAPRRNHRHHAAASWNKMPGNPCTINIRKKVLCGPQPLRLRAAHGNCIRTG